VRVPPSQFAKQYTDSKEEALRYVLFKSNLRIINEHNAAFKSGASSFWMAMNSLTDLSDQEYRSLLGYKPKPALSISANATNCTHQDIIPPASVDWRQAGAVTTVRKSQLFLVLNPSLNFSTTGQGSGAVWQVVIVAFAQLHTDSIDHTIPFRTAAGPFQQRALSRVPGSSPRASSFL
jgi:hypothetical protein